MGHPQQIGGKKWRDCIIFMITNEFRMDNPTITPTNLERIIGIHQANRLSLNCSMEIFNYLAAGILSFILGIMTSRILHK
jgi:hypothetical protein